MAEYNPDNSNSRILSGQRVDIDTGVAIRFTRQSVKYDGDVTRLTGKEGNANTEIEPLSDAEARVEITSAAAAAFESLDAVASGETITRIDFPATLTNVIVTYNENVGVGIDEHPADQMGVLVYGTGSGSVNPNSKATGSASLMPDIQPIISERYHENVDAIRYTFWMANPSSNSAIRTALGGKITATILGWPQFKPESVTITANGQSASVSANADTKVGQSGDDTSSGSEFFEYGGGTSVETGTSTKTLRISPTIHAAIVIADNTRTATAEATADASTPLLFAGSFGETDAITNLQEISKDVSAEVLANGSATISATTPLAAIPTSGLYAKEITVGTRKYGVVSSVSVLVVNFATLV